MRQIAKACCLTTIVSLLALAGPAQADTFTVNTNADDGSGCDPNGPPGHSCTLRGAMSLAADNPPSTVIVPANYYVLTGHLALGPGVTVVGAGPRTTFIDAHGQTTGDRAFWLADAGSATLSQLTIANGRPNAGQHAGSVGGDVLVDGGGTLTLDHVLLTDGTADSGAGAAALSSSSLVVRRSLVDENEALTGSGTGGGISADGSDASALVQVSTVTNNAALSGGAASATSGGTISLDRATIASNNGTGIAGPGQALRSIVAGNTPSNCAAPLLDMGDDVETGTDCGFTDPSDRANADPALQGLANNGGATDTIALGATSAARDLYPSGCDTDQRDSAAPKGDGCDAGAFEADAPPRPPPPPPTDHTLFGFVTYQPAFAPGISPDTSNVFSQTTPPRFEVVLFAADGSIVQRQNLGAPGFFGLPDYRFDDLGACSGCRVALRTIGGPVVYSLPVSFDGDPGQTNALLYDLDRPGTFVTGNIDAPGMAPPDTLRVRIRDAHTGTTLADTGMLSPRCAHAGGSGATCAPFSNYGYSLQGLPSDGRNVIFELLQQGPGGPAVVVDSAVASLATFNGHVSAPELEALDNIPSGVRGRTVIGTVSYLGAYAPGAQIDTRLSLLYAPGNPDARVRLRDGSRVLGTARVTKPTTGSSTFRLSGLPACANCTLELLNGLDVVDKATVTLPSATMTNVTIRDLQLRAVRAHFLDGAIDSDDLSPRDVRVQVHKNDIHGPLIADSNDLPPACTSSAKCDTHGAMGFRLAGMPNTTPIVVVLLARKTSSWIPVDTFATTTSGVDQDSPGGYLQVPRGFNGTSPGRQLWGVVIPRGPFGPGADPVEFSAQDHYSVRLRNADGTQAAIVMAPRSGGRLEWKMNGLASCDGCQVELVNGSRVEDRAAVRIESLSPSVTMSQTLLQNRLTSGLISGEVFASRPSARLDKLEIRVQALDGAVLSSSKASGIPQVSCGPGTHVTCAHSYDVKWAIPAGTASGPCVVVARDRSTGRVLASEKVTVPSGVDTSVGTLSLKPEG